MFVAFSWGAALAARYDTSPLYIASCVFGGLLPDTDHRKSLLGRFIPLWILFKPHRNNVLHSPFGCLVTMLLWYILTQSYGHALFIGLGYTTHLLLDMCNPQGIRLFYPRKGMISILKFRTGGAGEILIAFLFYIIIVWAMSM